MPQDKNDNWIIGVIEKLMDSMIIALVIGTNKAASLKNGLSLFPLIYIPNGNANAKAPMNLSELKEAISGSVNPCFRR